MVPPTSPLFLSVRKLWYVFLSNLRTGVTISEVGSFFIFSIRVSINQGGVRGASPWKLITISGFADIFSTASAHLSVPFLQLFDVIIALPPNLFTASYILWSSVATKISSAPLTFFAASQVKCINDFLKLRGQSSKNYFNYSLHKRLLRSILIGTIPIVLVGGSIKLFFPYLFDKVFRSNITIALVSILTSFFMYVADNSKKGSINLNNHNYSDSFLIGFSQAFAIFPGVSRSGITISTALISGWDRHDAAKFSFLLGIPAIFLSSIFEFIFSLNEFSTFRLFPLIVGLTSTFLSSLLAIDFLLKYFYSNGLRLFIIYRIIFGGLILLNL